MAQARQSRALIIVNTDFCSSAGEEALGARRGAKREAEKLSKALSELNYEVKLMHNRTAKEMEDLYQQECSHKHGDFFVSIISSHGEEGAVFGSDCKPLKLTRIFQVLSPQNCPVLAERPKVFFIQACRGDALDQGVFLETDGGQPEPCSFSDYLRIPPNTAVMFACSPGYGAFLNLSGSRFLQALLRALDGEERGLALGRLATRLNRDVALRFQARGTYKGCMQMPCFVTNLTREVFPFSATSESCQLLPGPALQRGPEEEERQSGCKKSPAT
ncbi:caspase-3-like isoform X2 [Oxyura jamaicensis]|uniref:caspase-3-like isoform X2 n=1 Tax=Oxyura jamaicensis TaxID=8884 RepID=UPI0015A56A63|nr:caspase-3-like isoform X2 [Oxyura jamaicensis]